MNTHHTIPIVLFPQSCVRFEVIGRAHIASPINFFAPITRSCKIASDVVPGAILYHVNFTRIATTLPMVWTHPKRGGPCAIAVNHVNIEIKLLEIVHAERAVHF